MLPTARSAHRVRQRPKSIAYDFKRNDHIPRSLRTGWAEGESDYEPFVTYMLGVIGACYATLDERFSLLSLGGSSEDALREYFDSLVTSASKREIMDANPTMSQRTIERILQKLQAKGYIEKIGAARATRYRKIR